jgi:hypothetical protein
VLAVVSGFLFPAFLVPLAFLPCVLGLSVLAVSGFGFLVRPRLLWLLWLLWLLRACVFFLVCWVGFLLLVFPVRVPLPLRPSLRWLPSLRLFLVLVVACRLVAPVVWMGRCVVLLLVLVRCSFFLRLPPGLLVLVRWGRWLCVRLLVFVLLLAAVVVCCWCCPPALVLLVSVLVVRFVGAVRVRGVRRLWLLVWGGVSRSGFLLVLFLRLGLVFPGLLWGPGGGSVLLSLPRRCSCLCSSFVGRAAPSINKKCSNSSPNTISNFITKFIH